MLHRLFVNPHSIILAGYEPGPVTKSKDWAKKYSSYINLSFYIQICGTIL